MRLTLALLGWTFDWSLEPTSAVDECDPRGDVLTTAVTAQPLGFGEADCAPHFFDPSEGDEGRRIGFGGRP